MKPDFYKVFGRRSSFFWSIVIAAQYVLGIGVARFLGAGRGMFVVISGAVFCFALFAGGYFLNAYFDEHLAPQKATKKIIGDLTWQNITLILSATGFVVAASVTILFQQRGIISRPLFALMLTGFLGAVFYGVPPVRLRTSGYGELLLAVLFGSLIPSFSFVLVFGGYDRLILMSTFPITLLCLILLLALNFPEYARHQRRAQYTMLTRMGWQMAVQVHHALVYSAFLSIVVFYAFGFPRSVALPLGLLFPLGLLQIYSLNRIAYGAPANWNVLVLTAMALFGLISYLQIMLFWL